MSVIDRKSLVRVLKDVSVVKQKGQGIQLDGKRIYARSSFTYIEVPFDIGIQATVPFALVEILESIPDDSVDLCVEEASLIIRGGKRRKINVKLWDIPVVRIDPDSTIDMVSVDKKFFVSLKEASSFCDRRGFGYKSLVHITKDYMEATSGIKYMRKVSDGFTQCSDNINLSVLSIEAILSFDFDQVGFGRCIVRFINTKSGMIVEIQKVVFEYMRDTLRNISPVSGQSNQIAFPKKLKDVLARTKVMGDILTLKYSEGNLKVIIAGENGTFEESMKAIVGKDYFFCISLESMQEILERTYEVTLCGDNRLYFEIEKDEFKYYYAYVLKG